MAPRVVCLLPARNAAADLPGFFAAAATVCDAVVALDDGSIDETRALLAAHPLVARLLTNPVRPDYAGWDDAANRNRLLDAASDLAPDWILSLDADERIDPGDAAALRTFLATDALPGCAYGFQHVPMRGDPDHHLPWFQWVYRLFAFAPGQRFPDRRLHFAPVPTAIPRSRWIRTTLRIQHFGGATTARRIARFAKYLEADPERVYQDDYAHLLAEPAPGELVRWTPRPPGLPVLEAAIGLDERGFEGQWDRRTVSCPPVPTSPCPLAISAVVIARDDAATIDRAVGAVLTQECPEPFETIVVVSGSPRPAAAVRARFPEVTLVELERPVLPGEARNAGLRLATGEFVTFPGSHVELLPGSLAARLAAHRRGYALVTGVTLNGTRTAAGWASYFLDHHEHLPGLGPTVFDGPPGYCSYPRALLADIGGFPERVRTGEDTAVNQELVRRGYVAVRDPAVRMVHYSPCRTPWRLVRHHFVRGRGWGRLLLADYRERGGLLNRHVLATRFVGHLPGRLARIRQTVRTADPDLQPRLRRVYPLVVAGAVASWLGMWSEVLRPAPGKAAVLWGRPVRRLALLAADAPATVLLVRLDLVARDLRGALLPPTLPVARFDGTRVPLAHELGLAGEAGETNVAADPIVRDVVGRALDLAVDDVLVVTPSALAGAVAGAGNDVMLRLALTPDRVLRSSLPRQKLAATLKLLSRYGPVRLTGAADTDADPAAVAGAARVWLRGANGATEPVTAPPRGLP
jgi:glycosyltransferase involved in cell wall biosynthesis